MTSQILTDKWSEDILEHGFTVLPNLLIRHSLELGLTSPEFHILVTIESYRWDSDLPWPSQQTLADITGYSLKSVNRITSDLQDKGLVNKIKGSGRSCRYDMGPLIEELEDIATR